MLKPEVTNTQEPPGTKSRNQVLKEIRERFGTQNAHTLWLIDHLLAAWDAADIFTNVFGIETAQEYLQAGFEPGKVHDDDDQ